MYITTVHNSALHLDPLMSKIRYEELIWPFQIKETHVCSLTTCLSNQIFHPL